MITIKNTYNNLVNSFYQTRVGKFAASLVGRQIINSALENMAEFGGYYAGAEVCGPIGKNVGGALGRSTGGVSSMALSVLGAKKAAEAVHSHTDHLNGPARAFVSATAFAVVVYLLHTLLFANLSQWGQSGGAFLGETLAYIGVGMLTAFFAMALCNTKETLWDSDNIARSYIGKTIQSMLICSLISYFDLFPSEDLANNISNLIVGSLAYNLLDIKDVATGLKNGTLLNGMPQQIDAQRVEPFVEANRGMIVDKTINAIPIPSIKATVSSGNEYLDPVIASALDNLQKMVEGELRSLLKTTDLTTLIAAAPDTTPAINVVGNTLFSVIVRSCNKYCEVVSTYPALFNSLIEIDHTVFTTLDLILEKRRIFLEAVGPVGPFIRPHLARLDQLKNIRLQLGQSANLLPLASPKHIGMAATEILETMGQAEEMICGFRLFPATQYRRAESMLKVHIEWIVNMAILESIQEFRGSCTEAEVRQCYKNMNHLFHELYAPALGYLAPLTEKIVDHQLTHSQFHQ